MYYFSNIPNISSDDDPYHVRNLPFTVSSSGKYDYYQLNAPFILQFETSHPESEDSALIFTTLAPEASFYSLQTLDDKNINTKVSHLHQHDYYELVFVLEGEMYQIIEQHRHLYTAGSCCLLNRNIRHTEELSTDFRAAFLAMSYDFLHDLFRSDQTRYFDIERNRSETILEKFINTSFSTSTQNEKGYIDFILENNIEWVHKNIHDIFEQISNHIINPEVGSSLIIKGLFYRLLHLLDTSKDYRTTPIRLGTEAEAILFNEITKLVKETNGRITRSELEKVLNYSGDYINKIVKKFTGLNIFDYGMTYCLNEAIKLLIETNLSVTEIATKLNFSNRAHFYKQFQNSYGMTPKEYRKKMTNK
jgi:AraC-like DNA-binding protein